jgi:hypothetical protein
VPRPAGAYDRSLRAVMWWDAFLSLEVALLAIVALPIVMLADLPRSSAIVVGVAAILTAIILAACGAVTAVLIGLRMRLGDDYLPARMRLPLPALMRPALQDGGFEARFARTSTTEAGDERRG